MTRLLVGTALLCGCLMRSPLEAQDSARAVGWRPIVITAAAIAVGLTLDADIAQHVEGTESVGTLTTARQFDRFGDATGIVPIIGGVALAGVLFHDSHLLHTALLSVGSVAVASAFTQVSKYAVGRVRPDADPDRDGFDVRFFSGSPAFPSGHTAAAFAMATSLGDAIDKTWARVGLYALATGTGWARITEEKHWLSDVLGGAALGIVSARWVSGRVHVFGMRAPSFLIGARSAGVQWNLDLPPAR